MSYTIRRSSFLARVAAWLLTPLVLVIVASPALASGKKQAEPAATLPAAGPLEGVSALGIVRIGDTQILYGLAPVPCESPSEVCQIDVKFQAPFVENPVVTLTTLANAQTQKVGVACLLNEKLSVTGFVARVLLQSNVKELKKVPWMAIGRWR